MVGFTDPDDEWCLVFERGDRQGFFDEREQADLVRFAGPLGQAAALARSIAYANAASALDAYQSIGCASFLIGRTGRVVRYNEQAQRLLGDGLDLSHGVLRCSHAPDNAALAELIASRGAAPAATAQAPIAIVRRPLKRPLIVRAVSLTGLAASIFSPGATILLVSDAEQRPPSTQAKALSKAFGLTATEAALVANLEQDISLQDAAELMTITLRDRPNPPQTGAGKNRDPTSAGSADAAAPAPSVATTAGSACPPPECRAETHHRDAFDRQAAAHLVTHEDVMRSDIAARSGRISLARRCHFQTSLNPSPCNRHE